MSLPLLQVALDHTDLPSALTAAEKLRGEVDVMEVGTILCYAEGARAVQTVSALYPDNIIVADLKAADAGSVVADMVFSRGATWMTCICSAPLATMKAAREIAQKHNGDIQVELYGDWSFDHAAQWKSIGITQCIYHRGRDAAAAGESWGEEDLKKLSKLADMGMDISATGGLAAADLHLFKDLPIKSFISGRALYDVEDPQQAARDFKVAINEYWG